MGRWAVRRVSLPLLLGAVCLNCSACVHVHEPATEIARQSTATIAAQASMTPTPTLTVTSTPTLTVTPTVTLTPTVTSTPTPVPPAAVSGQNTTLVGADGHVQVVVSGQLKTFVQAYAGASPPDGWRLLSPVYAVAAADNQGRRYRSGTDREAFTLRFPIPPGMAGTVLYRVDDAWTVVSTVLQEGGNMTATSTTYGDYALAVPAAMPYPLMAEELDAPARRAAEERLRAGLRRLGARADVPFLAIGRVGAPERWPLPPALRAIVARAQEQPEVDLVLGVYDAVRVVIVGTSRDPARPGELVVAGEPALRASFSVPVPVVSGVRGRFPRIPTPNDATASIVGDAVLGDAHALLQQDGTTYVAAQGTGGGVRTGGAAALDGRFAAWANPPTPPAAPTAGPSPTFAASPAPIPSAAQVPSTPATTTPTPAPAVSSTAVPTVLRPAPTTPTAPTGTATAAAPTLGARA